MYPNKEGIFDHPPINSEPTHEPSTGNTGKSTNRAYWIIGLGLVIVCCVAGYYIVKYSFYNSQKKKRSSTMYMD